MSAAARSIFAYSIYTFGLGATLLLAPNIPLPIFGLPQAQEVWVRVAGMTVMFLAIFYFVAAQNEFRPLFVASAPIRFGVEGADGRTRRVARGHPDLAAHHPPAQLPARDFVGVHTVGEAEHPVAADDVPQVGGIVAFRGVARATPAGSSEGGRAPGQECGGGDGARPRCAGPLAIGADEQPEQAGRLAPVVGLPHLEFEKGQPIRVESPPPGRLRDAHRRIVAEARALRYPSSITSRQAV
jgi:hypothetical protein